MTRDEAVEIFCACTSRNSAIVESVTPRYSARLRAGRRSADSDLDIMIELEEAGLNIFDYVGTKDYIAGLFEGRVDAVNRAGLKPYIDLRRR